MTAVAPPPQRIDPQPSLSEHLVAISTPRTPVSQGTIGGWERYAPVVSVPTDVMASSWFRPTISQFETVLSLPRGWDTYGGVPVSRPLLEHAMSFLGSYLGGHSLAPTVVPLSDGGVQLVWHEKGLDLEVTFSASEEPEAYVHDLATQEEYDISLSRPDGRDVLRGVFERLTV